MRRQRFGTFAGGIDLPDEKHTTLDAAIEPVARPSVLQVALDPCRLGSVRVDVEEGRHVCAGDRLAVAAGTMPTYAPADAVVGRIGPALLAGRTRTGSVEREGYLSPSVELTDLGEITGGPESEPSLDWREAAPGELIERIGEGGLTTFAEPLRTLTHWCQRAIEADVDTIIVNGLENEPYLTGEHRLMVSHGSDIVTAAAILARAVGADKAVLAVDARRIDRYRRMAVSAEALDIESLAFEHKYPVGNDKMLTAIVTGRVPRPEQSPLHVGAAVVTPACCFALAQWMLYGRRPTSRVVTVSGLHVRRPANVVVPFGMPVEHVMATCGGPIEGSFCHGGPMTGAALAHDAVVGPTTSGLLSLRPPDERPASPCIRCGWCTNHCPVRLDVASLNDMFELRQLARARRYDVVACLGCGVCSYVCPARLPLTHRVQTLKQIVYQADDVAAVAREATHG